jgi:hypothetical protein
MTKETGKAAFPLSGEWAQIKDKGMTLRDYFAATAIVGHLADGGWKCDQSHFEDVAEGAYRLADAMLEARK